jgi:hypothetical protein
VLLADRLAMHMRQVSDAVEAWRHLSHTVG